MRTDQNLEVTREQFEKWKSNNAKYEKMLIEMFEMNGINPVDTVTVLQYMFAKIMHTAKAPPEDYRKAVNMYMECFTKELWGE